ncbi:conserved hypothetical protein [Burkholderia cenocepacia]|nr:conserved hypothetical protein [Burkholderia cenocepacia]
MRWHFAISFPSYEKKSSPPQDRFNFVVHAQHRPAVTFRDCQEWGGEIARMRAVVYSCA